VLDCNGQNIRRAVPFLTRPVEFELAFFDASSLPPEIDLLIVPLAFRGDRRSFYAHPPARNVLVHDWIWRRTNRNAVVSPWLFKRLNLVTS
jgi:hypothetical protein